MEDFYPPACFYTYNSCRLNPYNVRSTQFCSLLHSYPKIRFYATWKKDLKTPLLLTFSLFLVV